MSLETQITNLVSQYTALKQRYESRIDEIDAAVAGALQTIPEMTRTYYVSNDGDDDAAGSAGAPLATFAEAVRRTPAGGRLIVRPRAGQAHDVSGTPWLSNIYIEIIGYGDGEQPTLNGSGVEGVGTVRSQHINYRCTQSAMFGGIRYSDLRIMIQHGNVTLDGGYFAMQSSGPGMISVSWDGGMLVTESASETLIRADNCIAQMQISGISLPPSTTWADLIRVSSALFTTNVSY